MSLDLSLIIPSYNMAEHLPRLFKSLAESGVLKYLREVLFVNDGSTDQTSQLIHNFSKEYPEKVRIITLLKNRGRFYARLEGATASKCEKILFLDTRLELESGFNEALLDIVPSHNAVMGVVNIDTKASIFSLYWERTHRVLFKKHFEAAKSGFFLTEENYDRFLKGTTVFFCNRQIFIDACRLFSNAEVLSDDMALLKVIVEKSPIWVDSRLSIRWRPREDTVGFLLRLWERGPSFVEYHVFIRRSGPLFWIVLGAVSSLIALAIAFYFEPFIATLILIIGLIFMLASVFLFAKSFWEAILLVPLHLATLVVFGVAIFRGLIINTIRVLDGKFPKLSTQNSKKK